MTDLPQAFIDQMAAQLGDELPAFLRSYEEPYQRGVRLNLCKATDISMPAAQPEGMLEQVPWEPCGRYLSLESRAGAAILHEAGAWYLQEPSAMLPTAVLAPQPGERVLDLCAAPGGKSTQLGLRMAGQGSLVCNEPIRDRAKVLSRNLERMGVTNAVVTSAYPDRLAACWPGAFDAIQCDAPCSGEGMFRRQPETRAEWNAASPAGCAKRQGEILDQAAVMLRPGGRMVYSTCTLNTTENEGVIEAFLSRHPDFALQSFSLPGVEAPRGMHTCYPHRMRGEGHFVALLVRTGDGAGMPWAPVMPDKSVREALRAAASVLPAGCAANDAWLRTSDARAEEYELYCLPDLPGGQLPRGIQVLRRGLHLGSLKVPRGPKGRAQPVYTPDHALALSIRPPQIVRIDLTEDEARRYQQGQTIEADGRGWVLACFAGVALGWGKISDGVMKNHYPKGRRR